MMTHFYRVAGHCFSITIPEGCPLGDMMGNYAPFEIERCSEPLFTVELVDKSLLPPLEKEVVYNDPSDEPDQPKVEIYRNKADGEYKWLFECAPVQKMAVCVKIVATEDFSKARFAVANYGSIGQFGLNNAMMLIFAFRTASYKTLEMHSSVIMHGGKGYMFLGKSGTGKSTHSSLWMKYIPDCVLLNDDNPIVRISDDGVARVYGSPWSGKTPCYKNLDCPVGAIVRLAQYKENRIRRCNALSAYAAIFPSCSGLRTIDYIADGLHETIEKLALDVPCYELDCLPDEGAAVLCHDTVTK